MKTSGTDSDNLEHVFAAAIQNHQEGRLSKAEEGYRAVLRRDPLHASAWHFQGVAAFHVGDLQRALPDLHRAVALSPSTAMFHGNLGEAIAADRARSRTSYLRAISCEPTFISAYGNLIGRASETEAPGELARFGRRHVGLDPRDAVAHSNLGLVLQRSGRLSDSERSLRRAAALQPRSAMIVANLARILAVGGDRDEAVAAFEKAVQLDPLMAGGHNNLGRAYKELGRITDASVSLRRAVALSPSEPEVLNNLGILGFACGDARVASVGFRRAIATDGHRPAFVSNLVTALLYADDTEPRRLFEAASLSDHVVRSAVGTGSRRSRGSAERLRVGIVSADLCDHPVGRNVLGVFEHCRRIALHVYADVPREDGMTAEFRRHADAWTTTVGQSDAEVAETVGRDGIDLLVVLAGHTAGNRPALAAHRAARVQVGFHDLTTSGIIGMDWWLTDSRLHPEGSSELFTERLWRLPCFYLHRPPAVAPAVGPAPWRSRGGLSFISCNNAGKISRSTIRAWSRVLRAVPGSRLILKYRDWFADRAVQRSFAERFEDAGVNRDRLDFLGGHADRGSHLALLNQADIALDTFPFNGSTTSFEALWMGVPVVTWAGDRFVGRVGASVLGAVGLDRLVGRDEETFVASAVALAEDKYFLEELRGGLRNRVMQSPLCDAENYTRTLEEAFLRMCA